MLASALYAGHAAPEQAKDIGGLAGQIEQNRDAIELPCLQADLFKEHQLKPPKGSCSTGRPAAVAVRDRRRGRPENVVVIGASDREDMIDQAIGGPADSTSRSRSSGQAPRRPRTSSPSACCTNSRCTRTTWPSTTARPGPPWLVTVPPPTLVGARPRPPPCRAARPSSCTRTTPTTKGASYGSDENYLMRRAALFADIVKFLVPFFVSRQVICGAGRGAGFQISQRTDFFEVEVWRR